MENHTFYLVDVFTDVKYEGNQLAVVLDSNKTLSDEDMQRIAREMHFSETTFILSIEKIDDGYPTRIFTPEEEVPFAGHPTLGTAFIIQQEIIKEPTSLVNLNLEVGQIPVSFDYQPGNATILWMKQKEPMFGEFIDKNLLSQVLNINFDDIDEKLPIQEVSTGLPFIIVPIKSLDAVKRATINKGKYSNLIKDRDAKAILIFCPETYHEENDLNVRVFVDYYGVPEDPATGSGNGCLAGYLSKYKFFGDTNVNIKVEQGYEIRRRSLLLLKANLNENNGKIEVLVGGSVRMVAKGNLM